MFLTCNYIIGLSSNGTVVDMGNTGYMNTDIDSWTDIVSISANHWGRIGLRLDGTVVVTGWDYHYGQTDVEDWTDICVDTCSLLGP